MPVQGETTPEGYAGWRLDLSYGTEHRQIVDAIVKEWLDSEEDPSIGAVWFGKEKFYKKSR